MKPEQFNQLQSICALDVLCYSLESRMKDLDIYIPKEIADRAELLQKAIQSFRDDVWEYIARNKDTYIDKDEV